MLKRVTKPQGKPAAAKAAKPEKSDAATKRSATASKFSRPASAARRKPL